MKRLAYFLRRLKLLWNSTHGNSSNTIQGKTCHILLATFHETVYALMSMVHGVFGVTHLLLLLRMSSWMRERS